MITQSLTAEDFVARRHELPDGGRWTELESGSLVELSPPSIAHGNAVLNLSRSLADWIEQTREGYACFELGLILERAPDRVYCPPISYFVTGSRWEELDHEITSSCPALVIEIASSPDRCRALPERVGHYLRFGVDLVWIVDPRQLTVAVHRPDYEPQSFGPGDVLTGQSGWRCTCTGQRLLSGFVLPVASIFREPDWWLGGRRGG